VTDPYKILINNNEEIMKKGFKEIEERELHQKIEKLVPEDSKAAKDVSDLSIFIRKTDANFNKANYLRTEDEKKQFIQDIKAATQFDSVVKQEHIVKKMIDNGYFEFLLPHALSSGNFDEYKNIEIVGIGYYDDNAELFSQ
jgi:hypothetical protein